MPPVFCSMRWTKVWISVGVVAVLAGSYGASASSRTLLVGNGYEEVVVGLSPQLDESQGPEIIEALKRTLNDTSHALFAATGNRFFLRKVKILVPSSWRNVTVEEPATSESYEASDLRVDLKNDVYGDQVYTVQPGGCGEPGKYTHITPTYLTHPDSEDVWGPRGKVLAQAWARLRWGVFDEVGYPEDDRYPLFYRTWDSQQMVVMPNHCANKEITGRYEDQYSGGSCSYVDGLPNDNCRFVPDDQQTSNSSLMSFTTINSIQQFCSGGYDDGSHNSEAPNRHNLFCEGRSAGSVVAEHPDFLNATVLPLDHPVSPEVVVVQEVFASFALVLDYSGSMGGLKIDNLATTAKRWLLYDVADGSYVTIIKFEKRATLEAGLTEVTNTTRQQLADAIDVDTGGTTCIGCGLRMAVQELSGQNNKVILLISDGGENESPDIDDVMSEVVESGARVVSIAYGTQAEQKMESLAQNTGGKAYIVPDDDDGTFMDDAFQGSLTYQPGQSLTNIDIEIFEDKVLLNNTFTDGTFTVDATVGRNLEFRLDTIGKVNYLSPPYLLSPTGVNHTDANFTDSLNMWIITVDMAEVGTWAWFVGINITNNTDTNSATNATVRVTAQARDPETLPIYTESWMNTGVDYVNATHQPVIVYARVTQGEKPVVGAKVRAYITTPNISAPAVELDLLDNGKNADMQEGDGVYSRYYTQFVTTGRYAVKAQVWDEGSSYINNGFITSRRSKRSAAALKLSALPIALARLVASNSEQLDVREQCCGSKVPFDKSTATPTGDFTRNVAAGSFNVVAMPEGDGDVFPPARVLDLRIDAEGTTTLMLKWTAPGDDYDTGTVSGYEIWISNSSISSFAGDIIDENNAAVVPILDYETSSDMTEILVPAGEEVTLTLTLSEPLRSDSLYFSVLKAVDDSGNKSPWSGQATFTSAAQQSPDSGGLEPWGIALIVIGCVLAVTLIVGVGIVVYKRHN